MLTLLLALTVPLLGFSRAELCAMPVEQVEAQVPSCHHGPEPEPDTSDTKHHDGLCMVELDSTPSTAPVFVASPPALTVLAVLPREQFDDRGVFTTVAELQAPTAFASPPVSIAILRN